MMGVLNENLPEGEEERKAAAVAQAEQDTASAGPTQAAQKPQAKTGRELGIGDVGFDIQGMRTFLRVKKRGKLLQWLRLNKIQHQLVQHWQHRNLKLRQVGS